MHNNWVVERNRTRYGPVAIGAATRKRWTLADGPVSPKTKKADVMKHPKAFDHVGLLVNQPPDTAGLLSVWSSDELIGKRR